MAEKSFTIVKLCSGMQAQTIHLFSYQTHSIFLPGNYKKILTLEESLLLIQTKHLETHNCRDRLLSDEDLKEFHMYHVTQKVNDCIRQCLACCTTTRGTSVVPINPIISSNPGERIIGDLKKMPEADGKMKYILVVVDHFSKYTWSFPLQSKEATPIRDCFEIVLKQVIEAGHKPKYLHTDNGREFKNSEVESLVELLSTEEAQISTIQGRAYHPQSQGLCERKNGTIANKLLRICNHEQQGNAWAQYLSRVVLGENTSKATTGFTPYVIFWKREMGDNGLVFSSTAYLRMVHDARHRMFINADKAKSRQAQKKKLTVFKVGDSVLVNYERRSERRRQQVFKGKWSAKATIHEVLMGHTFRVKWLEDIYTDEGKLKFHAGKVSTAAYPSQQLKKCHIPKYSWVKQVSGSSADSGVESVKVEGYLTPVKSSMKSTDNKTRRSSASKSVVNNNKSESGKKRMPSNSDRKSSTKRPRRDWNDTDVFGATLWDNDENGCFVSAFLAMCMVVKQLLKMSDDEIVLLTPLATLVFSGLPGLVSPEDAVGNATLRFTENKKHKDDVRRCMSEVFGACDKKPAKGSTQNLMDYLVEPPLPIVDEGERDRFEKFKPTDQQLVKTRHTLWFTPFEKKSKCKQCGSETKVSRHGLLENVNNYFKWTPQRVRDAKDGCMFAKYIGCLLEPCEQDSKPCAQMIDVASSSQIGESVKEKCRFKKVTVTQQLLSAKMKDILVVYTHTDNMIGTQYSVAADDRNMKFTMFGVQYQLVGIVSYPTNSRVHFVSHWFDGRNWWKYDDLRDKQDVPRQRCVKAIVQKFSSLDCVYVFANVANVVNLQQCGLMNQYAKPTSLFMNPTSLFETTKSEKDLWLTLRHRSKDSELMPPELLKEDLILIPGEGCVGMSGCQAMCTVFDILSSQKSATMNSQRKMAVYTGNSFHSAFDHLINNVEQKKWTFFLQNAKDTALHVFNMLWAETSMLDTLLVPLMVGTKGSQHYVLMVLTKDKPWEIGVADPLGAGVNHTKGHYENAAKLVYEFWIAECAEDMTRALVESQGGVTVTSLLNTQTTLMEHQQGGTNHCYAFVMFYIQELLVEGRTLSAVMSDCRCTTVFMQQMYRPFIHNVLQQYTAATRNKREQ